MPRLAFLNIASYNETVERGLDLRCRDYRPKRRVYVDLLKRVEVILLEQRAEYAQLDAL
jgi:hypothetical protein